MPTIEPKKISPLAKWLAVGMSAFMFAYGVFIIMTEHYYGYTSKLGGAEVTADGFEAIVLGIATIIFGLTPMSLWATSGKAAGFWAGTCMVLGVLLFLTPFYIR
ncbi:MAG: hypothetical protein HOP26_07795 [Methylotenera sp.]|nr:hypothetical protein [Methylotenera sp.]NOU41948.1 hypothetical protein [Methylotenera sp.]